MEQKQQHLRWVWNGQQEFVWQGQRQRKAQNSSCFPQQDSAPAGETLWIRSSSPGAEGMWEGGAVEDGDTGERQ